MIIFAKSFRYKWFFASQIHNSVKNWILRSTDQNKPIDLPTKIFSAAV
ncbi:hypothetical protein CFter6_5199 [Collimonas fungivorans]|uniref:Uncharacterized protein n=1 Tax=Collimonas fungivorans TaxID=158899 RepID=A0A127PIY7_9BURK|nr:hypothetical protein CFter6_5199 [Collimonas fungivorans]